MAIYIQILDLALDVSGEKCTAYQIENALFLELDEDKVRSEFGDFSICYVIEENGQLKFVDSGDLINVEEFQRRIEAKLKSL